MKHALAAVCSLLLVCPGFATDKAQLLRPSVEALVEASCIDCHDSGTKTALNFDELSFDLADADAFRMWENVYDKIDSGEMPPEKKPRPDPNLKNTALESLAPPQTRPDRRPGIEPRKSNFLSINLRFQLCRNGAMAQDGHTAGIIFSVGAIIATVSTFITLEPGDLVFTGTPAGVAKVAPSDFLGGSLEDRKLFELSIQ